MNVLQGVEGAFAWFLQGVLNKDELILGCPLSEIRRSEREKNVKYLQAEAVCSVKVGYDLLAEIRKGLSAEYSGQ